MHPLALAASGNNAGPAQISEMPRNLGLTLPENRYKITDAHFPAVHQMQQPEPGAVGERGKQQRQVVVLRRMTHRTIICALTYVSGSKYIRLSVCDEVCPWSRRLAFRNRSRRSTEAPLAQWPSPAACRRVATPAFGAAIRSRQISTVRTKQGSFLRKQSGLLWDAAIRQRSSIFAPEKPFLISVPAGASTCCSQPGTSVQPAKPTVWT